MNYSNGHGTIAVPTAMYRFIAGLVCLMMAGVVGVSGWSLLMLNRISVDMSAIQARMANAEARISSDSQDKDNDIRRVQADVERIGTRLENKIDGLMSAIMNDKSSKNPK
jgi:hypothetical protein